MKEDLGDDSRATRDASASLPEPASGLGHSVTPTIARELRAPCVIVDIDGTLSDASHRVHLVAEKKWPEFYDRCHLDAAHNHIGVIVNLLSAHYKIMLVTGRVERVRDKTAAWLDRHWVTYHALLMRPDGDHRPDDVLKEEILDRDILPTLNPIFALDDRDKVVAMWRRRGIPCLQVAPGDF